MSERWTAAELSRAIAVSRTHLTRLFVMQTGVPPTRFLTEICLTGFARRLEESDLAVAAVARQVGWAALASIED